MRDTAAIPEYRNIDRGTFTSVIRQANRPTVLRGVAADWPAVRAARNSATALADYLRGFDRGARVDMLVGGPAIKGRFFYRDDTTRMVNFDRAPMTLSLALNRIRSAPADNPPALAVQSTPVPDVLPGFDRDNALDLAGTGAVPRIWIGNAITVQTHFDYTENIAVVVGGRRRFTLFPPEQIRNLYVGPLDVTPAGQPISMVSLEAPNLARYPRFAEALASAQAADLEPGDAIYIPYFWWHHVKSLDAFNVLVNYWWNDAGNPSAPFAVLMHAMMAVRALPPEQRNVWRTVFDHYVFESEGDPAAHLNPNERGVLGPMTPELAAQIKMFVVRALSRP